MAYHAGASWNYLRVRGEYHTSHKNLSKNLELPPRARRIRHCSVAPRGDSGTTSACAENTFAVSHNCAVYRNYLRVRGEYRSLTFPAKNGMELPPRARRIQRAFTDAFDAIGTTSACAENTSPNSAPGYQAGNYLRVRGEYPSAGQAADVVSELPPRARRIPKPSRTLPKTSGTTSACAENTQTVPNPAQNIRNYLRVRGEYFPASSWPWWILELPPRARRIP